MEDGQLLELRIKQLLSIKSDFSKHPSALASIVHSPQTYRTNSIPVMRLFVTFQAVTMHFES